MMLKHVASYNLTYNINCCCITNHAEYKHNNYFIKKQKQKKQTKHKLFHGVYYLHDKFMYSYELNNFNHIILNL